MKWILVVFVMCCVVLASGCISDDPTGNDTTDNDTVDKTECEEQGGVWDYVSPRPEKMCNLPTSDGGAECNDSTACEGDCIADLSIEEQDIVSDGGVVETSGKCTSWELIVGCLTFVEDGTAEHIICID